MRGPRCQLIPAHCHSSCHSSCHKRSRSPVTPNDITSLRSAATRHVGPHRSSEQGVAKVSLRSGLIITAHQLTLEREQQFFRRMPRVSPFSIRSPPRLQHPRAVPHSTSANPLPRGIGRHMWCYSPATVSTGKIRFTSVPLSIIYEGRCKRRRESRGQGLCTRCVVRWK